MMPMAAGDVIGLSSVPSIAGANVDADGAIELLIGLGGSRGNDASVNIVDSGDGTMQSVMKAFTDGYGVSVAAGDLGF